MEITFHNNTLLTTLTISGTKSQEFTAIVDTGSDRTSIPRKFCKENANKPVFHNHYVHLGNDTQHCGNSPVVTAITFAKTGDVSVANSGTILKNLPKSSDGLSQNNNVGPVVSFTLRVVHDGNNNFICVDNIPTFDRVVQ
ncbi:MAG TPA: hypothetical protein VF884_03570 [Nitrososphaeraceae archaeon]